MKKKEYEETLKILRLSLKWNPVKVSAYMEMLECYIKLKNFDKFQECFEKALKIALTPMEISILYKKYAFFCIELKDYEMAYNILKYTALIYYRKENEDEINYLSSIAKFNLAKMPDLGTINYIREHDLEYVADPSVVNAYISLAKAYEKSLEEEQENINCLKALADIYTNLYFFECNSKTHSLQINTIRKYLELKNQ